MHITRVIKFLLHKRHKDSEKNLGIRMRVTIHGQKPLDFPLGQNIDLLDWNKDKQCALSSSPNWASINRTIDEWKSLCNEIFARYELIEKRTPTITEFKELFNDMIGRETKVTANLVPSLDADFFKTFDKFMSKMGTQNQWTDSTFEKFRAIKKHLQSFDSALTFSKLTNDKMQSYLLYLNKQEFRNTTISKHLAFVRWFFRWAALNGYYKGNVHNTFRPKIKGIDGNSKEIIYLSQDEIKLLQNYPFQPSQFALEQVRDVFLFCCFTGLRYSDVAKLKKIDIKDGYIDVVTQKTNDGLRIELNKHSKAILDKYKDKKFKKGLALPVISNQRMNDVLKELGQVCELNEPTRIVYFQGNERFEKVYPKWSLLTTHCARRTFVVTALRLGIPSEVIMKWTGHSDFKAMKPYVKIVDELKEKAMSKFDLL